MPRPTTMFYFKRFKGSILKTRKIIYEVMYVCISFKVVREKPRGHLCAFHEKSFSVAVARPECRECFTHQLKHVAPSTCDLLSVLWTDYISCTPSDHLYIPRRIVFTLARQRSKGERCGKKFFPANRGRGEFVR